MSTILCGRIFYRQNFNMQEFVNKLLNSNKELRIFTTRGGTFGRVINKYGRMTNDTLNTSWQGLLQIRNQYVYIQYPGSKSWHLWGEIK